MTFSRKCYFLITYLVCSAGLILQVNEVSQNYFKYSTRTRVNLFPHFVILVPSLSACFRVSDILNREQVRKIRSIDVPRSGNDSRSWSAYYKAVKDFSVADVIAFTPGAHEVIVGCLQRVPKVDYPIRYSSDECYQQFNVTKYYHRESMCYLFSTSLTTSSQPIAAPIEKLHLEHYTLTDTNYGMMFEIFLNQGLFNDIQIMSSYVHTPNTIKIYDSLLSHYVFLPDAKVNVLITYSSLRQKSKEPPYDTMCYDYGKGSGKLAVLMDRLQNETLRLLNESSPGVMTSDPLPQKLLSSHVLRSNETMRKEYRKIVERNQIDFDGKDSCSISCTIPKISFGQTTTLRLRLQWPDGLHYDVIYTPKLDLIDFVIYVCTCVGIWFGVSALSLFDFIREIFNKFWTPRKEIEKNKNLVKSDELKHQLKKLRFLTEYKFVQMRKKLEESDRMLLQKINSIQRSLN